MVWAGQLVESSDMAAASILDYAVSCWFQDTIKSLKITLELGWALVLEFSLVHTEPGL